jgi:putative aminopeptidase FrvX
MSSSVMLEKLSNAFGPSGNEAEIRQIIRKELEGWVDFSYDRLGSIICRRKGGREDAPKIMLAAHMDELGFIVQDISKDGFLKLMHLGSWWPHTLLAQRVIVRTAKGDLMGVIGAKPTHHLNPEERKKVMELKDMHVDVGAKDQREAAEEFGIRRGDYVVPHTDFRPLKNPRLVSGKAFDDRVGVGLMIETIRGLMGVELPHQLFGVGTVQEEVGTRGAETAPGVIGPDVAIVLEGAPADDTPGFQRAESQGELGKGPQIRLFDPTTITNRRLSQFAIDTAQELSISYQVAVRESGGTDAKKIHLYNSGVASTIISVPVRYAHSHVGVVNLDDFDHTLHLLRTMLKRLDEKTLRSFSDFRDS